MLQNYIFDGLLIIII